MSENVVRIPVGTDQEVSKASPILNSAGNGKPIGGSGLWTAGGFVYEPFLTGQYQGENLRRIIFTMAARDPTIRAILLAIKLPIRTVLWHMQPATDDAKGKAAAEFGESLIADMATAWVDVLSEILTQVEYGWAALEILLKRRDDGKIGLYDLQPRAQDTLYRWDFDQDGNVAAMHQRLPDMEAVIPAERLALFRTESHKNSPEGRSMILSAVDSYRNAKHIGQIESIAIERDFTGIPVAYIPSAAISDPVASGKWTQVVRDLKFNDQAGLLAPSDVWRDPDGKPSAHQQYRLELVSAPGRRSIDTDKIVVRHQTDMVRSVLADFLMLGLNSKGSYALSSDKSEMFHRSLQGLVASIEEGFDRFVTRRIWDMNGFPVETKPRWKAGRLVEANLTELGAFMSALGQAGFSVANDEREESLMEMAGLPVGTLNSDALAAKAIKPDTPPPEPRDGNEAQPGSSTPDKSKAPARGRAASARKPPSVVGT